MKAILMSEKQPCIWNTIIFKVKTGPIHYYFVGVVHPNNIVYVHSEDKTYGFIEIESWVYLTNTLRDIWKDDYV